jgi:hypothetical protein
MNPEFCPSGKDSDCSGANFKCDQNGFFCYDNCLRVEPPSCTSDDDCVSFYKNLDCSGTAYCRKDKGVCQYHVNGDNGCPKICTKDSDCPSNYCNISHVGDKTGCCKPLPTPGPKPSCNMKNCGKGQCCGPDDCPAGSSCKTWQTPDENGCYFCQDQVKENFTLNTDMWCRFNQGSSNCTPPSSDSDKIKEYSRFMTTHGVVGSYWSESDCGKDNNTPCVLPTKGGAGAALCSYGMYYDGENCVEQKVSGCKDSVMGVCNDDNIKDFSDLPLPDITLTWYAFVGQALTDGQVALDYLNTVLKFCNAAGIKKLTFPFIIPDKNNTPWMMKKGGTLDPRNGLVRVDDAIDWIIKNVLENQNRKGLEIGLNVYTSYKDSNWENFMTTPPTGKSSCDNTGTNGDACSWPYVAQFVKQLNDTYGKSDGITFLQVDKEQCECGLFGNDNKGNCKTGCITTILANNGLNIPLTVAVGLASSVTTYPSSPGPDLISVPEAYWDAGNQFPCDGSTGTYDYLTEACTNWSMHKNFKDNPEGFWNYINGTDKVKGSDWNDPKSSVTNYWLGDNNFQKMLGQLKDVSGNPKVNIWPSFSIENLSMCSGEMVLKGHDPLKGGGRWVCDNSVGSLGNSGNADNNGKKGKTGYLAGIVVCILLILAMSGYIIFSKKK